MRKTGQTLWSEVILESNHCYIKDLDFKHAKKGFQTNFNNSKLNQPPNIKTLSIITYYMREFDMLQVRTCELESKEEKDNKNEKNTIHRFCFITLNQMTKID